jgi:hypothetical protein
MEDLDLHSAERIRWLEKAYTCLRQDLINDTPKEVTIVAGFTSKGRGTLKANRVAASCCPDFIEKKNGKTEALIIIAFCNFKENENQAWTAPVQVLHTLLHEMIHASGIHNHRAPFSQKAASIGLCKPWTATEPSLVLQKQLQTLAEAIGPIPDGHGELLPRQERKQTTRMRKYTCQCTPKPRIIRTASDDLRCKCHDCLEDFIMEDQNVE